MPSTVVKIVADTVTPRLIGWADRMRREIETELDVVGARMFDLSRTLVPVRTGFLRSSIAYDVRDLSIYLSASAKYSAYVEYGTSRMVARPYLRPSVDAYTDAFAAAIITGVRNAWEL